tara:strand:+ start:2615 stop:3277 length:663 start_codon:yes stop_codon:yes gene_type:complete
MKKQHVIIFLSLSLICVSLSAQNVNLPTAYLRNQLSGKNNLPKNVTGSPYINDVFQKGQVDIGEDTFSTGIRYNGLRDEFEIKNKDYETISLLRRPDVIVTMEGKKYQIFHYMDHGVNKQGYFQVLNEGKSQLLMKQGVEFKDAVKASSSYGTDKPASLDPYKKYYIVKNGEPAVEVRLKKRDILDIFSGSDTKKYVSQNNLKLKNEFEVITLLNYTNSK